VSTAAIRAVGGTRIVSSKLPDSWHGDDTSPAFGPFIAFKYATLFDALEREAYRRCGIKKMTLPSSLLFPDRPEALLDLVDFRAEVTRRSTPGPMKDNAWRRIAQLVRTRNEHWLLWALFTAKPKLGSVGYNITEGARVPVRKIRHAALVVEFGAALHRLDLNRAFVFNRMVDAAQTNATGRKRKTPEPPPPSHSFDAMLGGSHEPPSRLGLPHEDTEYEILEWLVQQINERGNGHITDRQETLIRRTYLDREPLKQVADDLGMSEPSASKMRKRGTDRLALYLNRPDLIEPDNDTTPGGQSVGDATATTDQTTPGEQSEPEAGDYGEEFYDEDSEETGEEDDAAAEYPW
jgi:hypothetical protein